MDPAPNPHHREDLHRDARLAVPEEPVHVLAQPVGGIEPTDELDGLIVRTPARQA